MERRRVFAWNRSAYPRVEHPEKGCTGRELLPQLVFTNFFFPELGYLQQGNPNLKIGRAQCFAYQNHPPTEDANRARILRPPRTATQKSVASLHPTHFSARALQPASSSPCELGKPVAQALHRRWPSSGASSPGSSPAPCAAETAAGSLSSATEKQSSSMQHCKGCAARAGPRSGCGGAGTGLAQQPRRCSEECSLLVRSLLEKLSFWGVTHSLCMTQNKK